MRDSGKDYKKAYGLFLNMGVYTYWYGQINAEGDFKFFSLSKIKGA